MSDTSAVLLVIAAAVVGALVIGVPWVRWSQRKAAASRFNGGLDVCDRIDRIQREDAPGRIH